jgi:hypothetical protein
MTTAHEIGAAHAAPAVFDATCDGVARAAFTRNIELNGSKVFDVGVWWLPNEVTP